MPVTKSRILEAVHEGAGEQAAQLIDHLKKGDMAREAERLLADSGWLPEPLCLIDQEHRPRSRARARNLTCPNSSPTMTKTRTSAASSCISMRTASVLRSSTTRSQRVAILFLVTLKGRDLTRVLVVTRYSRPDKNLTPRPAACLSR